MTSITSPQLGNPEEAYWKEDMTFFIGAFLMAVAMISIFQFFLPLLAKTLANF